MTGLLISSTSQSFSARTVAERGSPVSSDEFAKTIALAHHADPHAGAVPRDGDRGGAAQHDEHRIALGSPSSMRRSPRP